MCERWKAVGSMPEVTVVNIVDEMIGWNDWSDRIDVTDLWHCEWLSKKSVKTTFFHCLCFFLVFCLCLSFVFVFVPCHLSLVIWLYGILSFVFYLLSFVKVSVFCLCTLTLSLSFVFSYCSLSFYPCPWSFVLLLVLVLAQLCIWQLNYQYAFVDTSVAYVYR